MFQQVVYISVLKKITSSITGKKHILLKCACGAVQLVPLKLLFLTSLQRDILSATIFPIKGNTIRQGKCPPLLILL